MILSDFDMIQSEGMIRAVCRVKWEENPFPQREVYFETEEAFADGFMCNPHAFLVGCLMPAIHYGEKRVAVREPICPVLLEGVDTVMGFMHHWYGEKWEPISIEAPPLATPRFADRPARAGYFMSGGIDSLTALRLNRLRYPQSHPAYIRDGLIIHGFDIGGVVRRGMKFHVFERARQAMAAVAREAGLRLIPVYTNIRHLCDDRDLWLNRFFGAVLAAVAHCFAKQLTYVHVASSYDIPNLAPCGSHPLIDPAYSSYDLRIHHRDVAMSRIEKIKIVAQWDVALNHLRVCLANVADRLNCGKCEKCVRTMAGLVAVGALKKCKAFEEDDLTADHFSGFRITIRHRDPFYKELIAPLEAQGRDDLVAVIRQKLAE